MTRAAHVVFLLALLAAVATPAAAQRILAETMQRHGVTLPERGIEGAFDEGAVPTVAVTAGSFAAPLALLAAGTGRDRIDAAYAFGILAGRSAKTAAPADVAAAGRAFIQMMGSPDRRTRIAGARVSGRVFTAPLYATRASVTPPPGLIEAVFSVFNQDNETEQLAAMDALGLVREATAVPSLTERYHFYRDTGRRALAGGALEALARIGDPSSIEIVRQVAADKWAEGRDATALAVAFARERLLKDGSIAMLQQAVDDKSRRVQARGYLVELAPPTP